MKRYRGFTIIELMLTLAVVAILATVAAPSFVNVIQNNRATTQANELVAAINLTRSEAVKRGVRVSLCSSSDQASCDDSNDWSVGWIAFVDTGVANPVVDEVLRAWDAPDGTPALTGPTSLRYRPQGDVLSAGQFSLEFPGCTSDHGRLIDVNASGRPNVSRFNC